MIINFALFEFFNDPNVFLYNKKYVCMKLNERETERETDTKRRMKEKAKSWCYCSDCLCER
jgi:hypothetical protein